MKRSLLALRKWYQDTKERAIARGDAVIMGAEWHFAYAPADDPNGEDHVIVEKEFLGEDGSGHPRKGVYKVWASAADNEDLIVVDPKDGEWVGDYEGASDDAESTSPMSSLAGQMLTLAKVTQGTLERSSMAESRAERRAAQAEKREEEIRKKYDDLHGAMDRLRHEKFAEEMARQQAEVDRDEAIKARDAALADLAEMEEQGGEMAPVIKAAVTKAYETLCATFGIEPVASDEEAMRQAGMMTAGFLMSNFIQTDDGTPVMLALYLVHVMGMQWGPLRVLFWFEWGVDFKTPPPINWQPPRNESAETAEAFQ